MIESLRGRSAPVLLAAAAFLASTAARAEPELPFACEAGVVLAGPGADAVVARGCGVARGKVATGRFRIGVVTLGPRVVVTVTRTADASGVERVARASAADIEDGRRVVGAIVDEVLAADADVARHAPAPRDRGAAAGWPPLPPPAAPASSAAPTSSSPSASTSASGASPSTAPPVSPSPPERSGARDDTRTILVDVRSSPGLRIMKSPDGSGTWETACTGSCSVALPLDASYRVLDDDGKLLRGFRLEPNGARRLTLDVSPRSMALDIVGALGVGGGVLLVVAGAAGNSGGVEALGVVSATVGSVALVANGASISQRAARGAEATSSAEAARRSSPLAPPRAARATLLALSF